MFPKILIYEYELIAKRTDSGLEWALPEDKISLLFLGLEWKSPLKQYQNRNKYFWGTTLGYDEDMPPIVDVNLELTRASFKQPVFALEAMVTPGKLDPSQRTLLNNLLQEFKNDPKFKIGWDDSIGGPRKRTDKAFKRFLGQLNEIPVYKGDDDLNMKNATVSIPEALEFFGYEPGSKPKDIKKTLLKTLKELQFKYHPDNSETGSEDDFLVLQKSRAVLEKWIKK